MSLDLNQIREKLNQMQKQSTGKKSSDSVWKPTAGKTQIRIVPYQFDKKNPFIEAYFHYNIGKRAYLSPITYGDADPIVEFCDKLKSTGAKEDLEMSRKFYPKKRIYVPVIVRGKESEGVKFWGFGKTVYEELLNFIVDPDYGDISDLENGRDLVINYTAASGANFASTSVMVKPNITPATDEADVMTSILQNQTEFYDVFTKNTYSELKAALETYLEGPGDEPETATTQASSELKTQATTDVDEAFDKLFNQAPGAVKKSK